MIEPHSYQKLSDEIAERMLEDRKLLDTLREEIRPLSANTRRIQPRTATAISLVGTDGGNNRLQFDPFLVQLIRIVDSSNNEYCLEAITPTTDVKKQSDRHFDKNNKPVTPLGHMMEYLNVRYLSDLSAMIRPNPQTGEMSPSWVQVYRELMEWAILFTIIRTKDFGTDTLIVFDGLLRSKVFAGDLFARYLQGIREGIANHSKRNRRKVYVVGVAKHSQVLTRYRFAMTLEHILATEYPAYVHIPREIERKAYVWPEYARDDSTQEAGGEINKFVGGTLFFVKFGNHPRDSIWPIDIFNDQANEAQSILGYLLADAINGFPVPLYPRCLQQAHENAALVGFDLDILQDRIFEGIRDALGHEAPMLDAYRLQDTDPARERYL